MGPAPEVLINLTVADLFTGGANNWNLDKVRNYLPAYEQAILAIKPSLTGAPNKLIWVKDATGEFTTKSGYATARKRQTDLVTTNLQLDTFSWRKKRLESPYCPENQALFMEDFPQRTSHRRPTACATHSRRWKL